MKCLLLALALMCGLQATAVPQAAKSLDIKKLEGTWHSVAMAASDITLLDSPAAPMRVFIKELRPTSQSSLEVTLSRWEGHACQDKSITAQQTQDPSVFTTDYDGPRRISVLYTDYDKSLFFCVDAATPEAKPAMACHYLARNADAKDQQAMEKFSGSLKALPVPMRIFLDLTQGQEPCQA